MTRVKTVDRGTVIAPSEGRGDVRQANQVVVVSRLVQLALRDRVAVDEVHDVLARGRAAARDVHGQAQGGERAVDGQVGREW